MKAIVIITNPGEGTEADTVSVETGALITPGSVVKDYAAEIENGALVTLLDLEDFGGSRAWQYIADTETGDTLRLRSNGTIASYTPLADVGEIIAEAAPDVELETFTVFGTNDDSEPFTAVITCDPEKVEEAAQEAGATSQSYAYLVTVVSILKGDQTDLKVA